MDELLGLPAGTSVAYANKEALTDFMPEQIIAEAQTRTSEGKDVRDTLLDYGRNTGLTNDQMDIMLGLPAGSTAAYAATNNNTNAIDLSTGFDGQTSPYGDMPDIGPTGIATTKEFLSTAPTAEDMVAYAQEQGMSPEQLASAWAQSTDGSFNQGMDSISQYLAANPV
jgi:hypothetical protein